MSDSTNQIVLIAVCLLISALSSALETALTSIPEARARQLFEEKGHRWMRLWIDIPERILATLLVTNNVVNILAASLMTDLALRLGTERAVAIATGVMTFLVLIFGEITPKTLARRYAAEFAPVGMPFIVAVYYALYPLVRALAVIPHKLQGLFSPGGVVEPRPAMTSEELEFQIDLGLRQGIIDRDRSELLSRVLEFGDIITREVMVPRMHVVAIPDDASRDEVLQIIVESEHSRIPVYRGSLDEIVGIVYARTLLADIQAGRVKGAFDLRRYIKPPFYVPELMKISRLLREFQRRKVHLAVVVDEFGGTAGVVALEDVVEEIVGEIQDEADVEEGRLRVLSDGTVIADASLTLRDLEDKLKVNFPEEIDYHSLGGFVTATAGRVPPVGSVVLWGGLRFTVRAGDERHVTRVEIARVPESGVGPGAAMEVQDGPDRH